MKIKTKKELEYEDAPSGYVTLYNYKEPFMDFKQGFGYEGVLLFDGESEKIQCHLCGKWFGQLPHHLHREHNMRAKEYKEKVGLRNTTALISESMREKLVSSGMEKRLQNLKVRGKQTQETKDKIRNTLKNVKRESQNERGTCPEQLLERLEKLYLELGRPPAYDEVLFIETLVKTYGSYENACKMANIPYITEEQRRKDNYKNGTHKHGKYSDDVCIKWIREFIEKEGRPPRWKDTPNGMWDAFKKKGLKKLIKQASAGDGKYRKTGETISFTDKELLDMLRNFEKHHKRKPSYSDCKRGLLPNLSRYSRAFGSWKKALKLAGI